MTTCPLPTCPFPSRPHSPGVPCRPSLWTICQHGAYADLCITCNPDDRVHGQASVGDLVSYEDMANPRKVYRVELVPHAGRPTDYVLADNETGALEHSDLRQYGWRRVAE